LLPKELIDKWNDAFAKLFLLMFLNSTAPLSIVLQCSLMRMKEKNIILSGNLSALFVRLFCARCHVPWHHGVACEGFQKLNVDEDLLLSELANQKKWEISLKCKFYIQIYDDCFHMTCRLVNFSGNITKIKSMN
jgi:E3 ubiquitin-protein ligase RNF144